MPGAQHIRVRCNGIAGDPDNSFEIFSYGFSIAGAGDFLTAGQEQAVVDLVTAYHSASGTAISSTALLNEVAFSTVQANQVQQGDTRRYQVTARGGSSGLVHPLQVAYRVSLGDGQRGRSHRGGWYVPFPNWQMSPATGGSPSTAADAALATAMTLITGINAATAANRVVIASQVLGNLPVTRVRVGNVLDTIRTRRNALQEAYSVADVPA